MADDAAVPDLIDQFLKGKPRATSLFFEFACKLTALAERQLGPRVRARVGGEDVVQSVFRTFLRRNAAGEFRFDSSAGLWQLLVEMTVRKAWAKHRLHRAGRRDMGRERGSDGLVELLSG